MEGLLVYLSESDRMAVRSDEDQKIEELHCGDFLSVWKRENARWEETRIEYGLSNDWYLVGQNARGISSLQERKVRTEED